MSDPEILPKVKTGEGLLSSLFPVRCPGMGVHLGAHRVFQIVARIIMRCWALAGAAVLACLLLYWAYGGLLAFLLLCFATTGKTSIKKNTLYFQNFMKCVSYLPIFL